MLMRNTISFRVHNRTLQEVSKAPALTKTKSSHNPALKYKPVRLLNYNSVTLFSTITRQTLLTKKPSLHINQPSQKPSCRITQSSQKPNCCKTQASQNTVFTSQF